MKKHLSNIFLVLVFLVGLSLLLYPSFSDYWNSMHQSRLISSYVDKIQNLTDDTYQIMEEDAIRYNEELAKTGIQFLQLEEEQWDRYVSLLDVTGTGIMGYIDIPQIKCSLPIYHGTDDGVLQIAAGHLEWSSLPVGGESTHSVLSGHRGLPSARLFTDIDQLREGDLFYLNILGDVLTYEVDLILTVLPADVDSLNIVPGEDLCTLVTCTPYGINTHRLLVRGHRIDTVNTKVVRVTADAIQLRPAVVAPFVAAPILLVLLIILITSPKDKRKK